MRIRPQGHFKVKHQGQCLEFLQFWSKICMVPSSEPNDFITFQLYLICGYMSVISLWPCMRIRHQGHFKVKGQGQNLDFSPCLVYVSNVSTTEPNGFITLQLYLICGYISGMPMYENPLSRSFQGQRSRSNFGLQSKTRNDLSLEPHDINVFQKYHIFRWVSRIWDSLHHQERNCCQGHSKVKGQGQILEFLLFLV